MSFVVRSGRFPEWAKDLPEGWRGNWLKWAVSFASANKPEEAEEENLPYISNEDIASWTGQLLKEQPEPADKDGRLFRCNDVLFNKLGPYLAKVYLAEFDGVSSGELLNLRASDRVYPGYLFYVVSSSAFIDTINAETFGTTRPRADWETVGHQPLPLPDLDTQQRIARFLDDRTARIDALIEKKRALFDRLAEKRQALITRTVTRGLNPDAPLKDSGIGWLDKVPAHWKTGNIRRFAKMKTGHTPSRSMPGYWDNCDIPWFTLSDIWQLRDDRKWYLGDTAEKISELGLANSAAELLPAGTVVLSRTASVGFSGIMPVNMATSQHFWNWVCSDDLRPEYLLLLFRSMGQEFERIMTGSTHQTIYKDVAAGLKICVPPLAEQDAIVAKLKPEVEAHYAASEKISASIEKLTEYRAALVTTAVTGKIASLPTEEAPRLAKQSAAPTAFKRSVLAAYIADTLCDHPTFGRVKFQKLLHLCEAHLAIQEVAGNYHRDAAGPFDTQMMRSVHSQMAKQGWIKAHKRDGAKGWLYRRGNKVAVYKDYFDRYFDEQKNAIDDLLALISPMNTQQAGIVSTAFAAWNDLLLEGEAPTDEEIVHLILNDWNESKQGIAADRWHSALHWMRDQGLVPRGVGEHMKRKGWGRAL